MKVIHSKDIKVFYSTVNSLSKSPGDTLKGPDGDDSCNSPLDFFSSSP